MKTNIATTILLLANLATPIVIFTQLYKPSLTREQQLQRANNRSDAMKVFHNVTLKGSWTATNGEDSIDEYIDTYGEDENIQYLYEKGIIKREYYQR